MPSERIADVHRRRRARRACFEPPKHVARADQDDDHVQPRIPSEDFRENQIQAFGADSGFRDAADVYSRGVERPQTLARPQQRLETARPERRLIEEIAFGLAAAGDEHAEEPAARTRDLVSPLSLVIDVKPH